MHEKDGKKSRGRRKVTTWWRWWITRLLVAMVTVYCASFAAYSGWLIAWAGLMWISRFDYQPHYRGVGIGTKQTSSLKSNFKACAKYGTTNLSKIWGVRWWVICFKVHFWWNKAKGNKNFGGVGGEPPNFKIFFLMHLQNWIWVIGRDA